MLSESPPREKSSKNDSIDDLFAIKRKKKPRKQLKFLENFNSKKEIRSKELECYSSKSLDLNLSLSAKKVETVGLESLNSSQQVFRNNLLENNSSHLLKHFGDIEMNHPDAVMTSRVMIPKEDRLLGADIDAIKPSSFSAQKDYILGKDKKEIDQYGKGKSIGNADKLDQNESYLKNEDKVATPDSDFLLNSEIVHVNEFDPVRKDKSEKEVDQSKQNTLNSFNKVSDINPNQCLFKEKIQPLNLLTGKEKNPFCIDDPKTERSEYPSENSSKKNKIDAIQNSMKNKNFLMSAGKGKIDFKLNQ
jgi:hypothetical protein